MNRIQITLISFVVLAFAKAFTAQAQQDFKAKATYMSMTKINLPNDSTMSKRAESDPMMKQIMESLKKGSQQEYALEFTRTESSYDKVQELKKPGGPTGVISMSFSASGGVGSTIYKNITDNTYIKQGNIMGKDFVIMDKLPTYEWQLLSESKKIGQYHCFKAVYTPVIKEKVAQDEKEEIDDAPANSGLISMIEKRDLSITAWYTPDIPVSNGPGEFHGLPGLIVEVQHLDTTILMTAIEMNPAEELELKKPKAGKKVSQAEFDEVQEKKMNERMKRNGKRTGVFIETIGF